MSTEPAGKSEAKRNKGAFSDGNASVGRFAKRIPLSGKDLWVGEPIVAAIGAAGGGWLGYANPEHAVDVAVIAATLLAVVIGAIVAALAIMPAALNESFLAKSKEVADEEGLERPRVAYFLSPFFAVILIGVLAGFSLLFYAAIPACDTSLRTTAGLIAGLFTSWTFASLLNALGNLVLFIDILQDSID